MRTRKIAFLHPGNAHLPELEIYRDYFTQHGFEVNIYTKKDTVYLAEYDIEWHLMGTDFTPKVPGRLKIHEYISLSLPPLSKLKNYIKVSFNTTPDLRIFHNTAVKQQLNFEDKAPYLFRDAGIGAHFFNPTPTDKKYDFVYHGSMHRSRHLDQFLTIFAERFQHYTLLVVGNPGKTLQSQFHFAKNIYFAGQVPYNMIPNVINQARYGLNYIPPIYPYYLQPSLKLLEYCALGLNIISTDYTWVNHFEQSRSGHFFKINKDWSNFYPDAVLNFPYKTPEVTDLQWINILTSSNILNFIQQTFVKD
ncbi:MAG: glycosyltransferase [Saprospiraceae bacterium]